MAKLVDHRSVGRIACELGVTVQRITTTAAKLSIQPTFMLDGVAYYTQANVEKFSEQLGKKPTPAKPTKQAGADKPTGLERFKKAVKFTPKNKPNLK